MPKAGVRLQRATGELRAVFAERASTALVSLRQAGCLKARFPRRQHPDWAEMVQLNNAGGIAGGDRLSLHLHATPGARVTLTTASAERIYRRAPGDNPAAIRNDLIIDSGAQVEWLPQETILFDAGALHRSLAISLAADAELLAGEIVVFGRLAMGETLHTADLHDVIRIRRDGRLILHDTLRPPLNIAAWLQHPAGAGGARASATLIRIAPAIALRLAPIRAVLAEHQAVTSGASTWDGMLVIRLLAADPALLRACFTALLHHLRDGRMLPRLWNC